ncbi:MAG TPA: poly(hydroxyalkanoate) granule-associated protein [Anaerolineae bacterium]|nr:poly(hydroxyalkanoate) granule-associated protein [Anaerolineae bacterium]
MTTKSTAAEEVEVEVRTEDTAKAREARPSFARAVRRVLLAGVGAMALTADEVEEFVDRLVERGELAEKEGRGLIKDVLSRRKGETEKLEAMLDEHIEATLHRLNVPTKSDIDKLSKQIAGLSRKIDQLKKSA